MEVKILKESLPVIQINFDEMKAALKETLEDYKGIVVTEETLPSCKTVQKELAGLRIKIDTYRKDKKKALSKPITDFENQCKELIALVEKAEQPIKDGIKVFDDEKREAKFQQAVQLKDEVVEEIGLNEKYATRMEIREKYSNLTAKQSEVKEDLTAQALTLKVEQDREAELLEIIKDRIESDNEKINSKLKFEDFIRYIDMGMTTKDVIAEIKLAAERIYDAENPKETEKPVETIVFPEEEPVISIPKYYAVYKIMGTHKELLAVSQFLKSKSVEYNVVEQGEI